MHCIHTNDTNENDLKWKIEKKTAEANLPTTRLPLPQKPDSSMTLNSLTARTHTELSPRLYRYPNLFYIQLFTAVLELRSADLPITRDDGHIGPVETGPLTLSGRFNELLFYIDTFNLI